MVEVGMAGGGNLRIQQLLQVVVDVRWTTTIRQLALVLVRVEQGVVTLLACKATKVLVVAAAAVMYLEVVAVVEALIHKRPVGMGV